jgi:DNA repair exonuclease SbcCD ATPase subunit
MQLARKIAGLLDELTLIDARDAALAELPAMPELTQEPTHERVAHAIDAARKRLTDAEQQAAAIASEEADIRRQMEALSATLGNRCPTCGCEVTAEALLDHIHGVAA